MLKKYSLNQFKLTDFIGYQELLNRELDEENILDMIKVFSGVNLFFLAICLLLFFIESGSITLLIISIMFSLALIILLGILYLKNLKTNVVFKFVTLGTQFMFLSLFFLCVGKYIGFDEKKIIHLTNRENLYLEIITLIFWFLCAFLGYFFYILKIRNSTYSKKSSYIQHVKKHTSKNYKYKYKNLKIILFFLIMILPAIPVSFIFFDKQILLFIISLFVSYTIIFVTPILFISAYFLKKFPEIYQEADKKNKRKPHPKAKAR